MKIMCTNKEIIIHEQLLYQDEIVIEINVIEISICNSIHNLITHIT